MIMTSRGKSRKPSLGLKQTMMFVALHGLLMASAAGGTPWIAELRLPTNLAVEAGNAEQLILPWIANLRITAGGVLAPRVPESIMRRRMAR